MPALTLRVYAARPPSPGRATAPGGGEGGGRGGVRGGEDRRDQLRGLLRRLPRGGEMAACVLELRLTVQHERQELRASQPPGRRQDLVQDGPSLVQPAL